MELPEKGAFFDFIVEREEIRLRRQADLVALEQGESPQGPPWTKDSILAEYKFTNVRRRHDRTTRELRQLFYENYFFAPRREVLFNCARNRYFGRSRTCAYLGWSRGIDLDSGEEFPRMLRMIRDFQSEGNKIFTGAYVITNQGIKAPKEEVVVDLFLKGLWQDVDRIVQVSQKTRSWRETSDALMSVQGFGGTGFMAKETLLDTMMTDFWGGPMFTEDDDHQATYPEDYWTWTPVGPGGLRGAARVAGDASGAGLPQVKAKAVIAELTSAQVDRWPQDWGPLVPTDVQFQLCEFDKYERVRLGQGRPRNKFKPRS